MKYARPYLERDRSARRLVHVASAWLLGLSLFLPPLALAQWTSPEVDVTFQAIGSPSTKVPFWLAANRFGTVNPEGSHLLLRPRIVHPFSGLSKWDVSFGGELVGHLADRNTVFLHQIYARLRYGPFEVSAGRIEETTGRVCPDLTVGSMTWSANAPPVPKIRFFTPDYVDVPGTDGFLAVRAYLAHGWLDDDRFVRGAFLHEKYLYLRVFRSDFPIQGHGGIIHNVIWGGVHPEYGRMQRSFTDYRRVVLAQSDPPVSNGATTEQLGTLGNTVAAYDFNLTFTTPALAGSLYRQFYLEDRPGLLFRNPWDGLWGVHLSPRRAGPVGSLVWEHVNTKRQGAKYIEGEPNGQDNYYNNAIYRSGWTYRNHTLGVPLLLADPNRAGIVNNIVVAHHVGLGGTLRPGLSYRLLGTYSRNYGARSVCMDLQCTSSRYDVTERRDQVAFLVEMHVEPRRIPGLRLSLATAVDRGEAYGNGVGFMLGGTWHLHRGNDTGTP